MNLSAETLHFIEEHRHDDVRTLALQGKKYPAGKLQSRRYLRGMHCPDCFIPGICQWNSARPS